MCNTHEHHIRAKKGGKRLYSSHSTMYARYNRFKLFFIRNSSKTIWLVFAYLRILVFYRGLQLLQNGDSIFVRFVCLNKIDRNNKKYVRTTQIGLLLI